MKHKCDVLVMIYGMEGRDAQALIPIVYLLKEKYKLKVLVRSIFDYCAIDILMPRILLTNGCTGSKPTYKMTRYAKRRGVFVISLHAEGMFRKENIESAVIGWNEDRQPSVDRWFFWNENAKKWAEEAYPQYRGVIEVSGSTLHEKYRIYQKNDFDRKSIASNKFKTIVLYVGWTFDKVLKHHLSGSNHPDPTAEREYVKTLLKELVVKNPDVLFIMKRHPGTFDYNEMELNDSFAEFENVILVSNEYSIYELMFLADIMINYDSTTALDAWLVGIPTISLYRGQKPMYRNNSFGYSEIRKGSLVPNNKIESSRFLSEFFSSGRIDEFDQLAGVREQILQDFLGDFSESPSKRIAQVLGSNLYHQKEKEISINIKFFLLGIINWVFYKIKLIPGKKSFVNMRKYYQPEIFWNQYFLFEPSLKRYFDDN